MSIQGLNAVGVGGCFRGFVPKQSLLTGFAVLLIGGLAQATPILNLAEATLQNAQAVPGHSTVPVTSSPARLIALEGFTANHLSTWTINPPGNPDCISSQDCPSAVAIPEAQSLLLVGTGLLSMAGMMRRKLLRREA
jgi:hypothetical protein